MGVLGVALLIFFVLIAVLLVLLVLVQHDEGGGLGGIFAGGSSTAFGSRSGNILTKTTTVLGSLFLVISLGIALMNRPPTGTGVEAAGAALTPDGGLYWFLEDDAPQAVEGEGADHVQE
ncbi:MAG: preprotein translocase subunit SecG [Treponema sp.]|jgi:preprotein translocase subunit SecG|nr:preprotein translocase subunit SecG [Treponema sp.]